ncbi:protein-histidine kinase [Gigaspora margarita]|uniref:histidine kinase n=2 Tax=Gigaspora margarita TaxID=4874 RepID=A0A8H4A4J4_GIGMA|nr:protein-histidine kinase [Gigaspora margarita]
MDDTANEKYHILLVDDNNDMRDHLADLLKEFVVYRACDGQDAMRVLKKLNKLPDLILSDIMMPNMNGYELLDVLRSNVKTQLIPVILLSAKASEDSKIQGLDKGADDYLIKPFSARELIVRVRTNIKLSLIRREILFQQHQQEDVKQLLLSISNMIISKSNLNETLLFIVKEIYRRLPCERIYIISNKRSKSMNNEIVLSYEGSENITPIINPYMDVNNKKLQTSIILQEYLINNSGNLGINISLNAYCDDIHKNMSILSSEIILDNKLWGWIKLLRSSNSIWFDSEIGLLQQISSQIDLAITYAKLLEENAEKEIQVKVAKIASITKSQILANTSHELRTPLTAIVGITSAFDTTKLTSDQNDMINILASASDMVVSIIKDILDVAKLEAQKIILINRTFDLLELFEDTIEEFGISAGEKKIELIIDYQINVLPRYVKSDPERLKQVVSNLLSNSVKFTDRGKIILKISLQSQSNDDENVTKDNLLIEVYDTGIGINSNYIENIWKNSSQDYMSVIKWKYGAGLGLSICKNIVEINGGEINVESRLGKGSKFWFTWNVESLTHSLLEAQFNKQISHSTRQKRILIIHPLEDVRNVMSKYLKRIEKVDVFDTFDQGIRAAKELLAYDIVFIGLYEDNKEEVLNAALELKGLEMNNNKLVIIFIVSPNEKGSELTKNLIKKVERPTSILYTPITFNKLVNQFVNIEN